MQLRLSHAVMYVRDLEAMIAFYRDVLGFQVSDRGPLNPTNPDLEVVFMSQVSSDHHQLAFVPIRGAGPPTTIDHIAFRVDSLADVREMAERLRADGRASDIGGVSHGNAWSVYFGDPEGNRLEVFCDSPYHVRQPQIRPLDLSADEDEIRQQTKDAFGDEPEFRPMSEFTAERRRRFGD